MNRMTRRKFLKCAVAAGAAAALPGSLLKPPYSAGAGRIREYQFSASKARVNLGGGPGFWAWTYNGQVPGPEIRVTEGETIRVVLRNFLPEDTTIHWHGVPVPNAMDGVPNVTQAGVKPGQTFIYEFEAGPAGSYIYHSHAHYQLDQGLYGPLIIEPKEAFRTYDREYTLMLEDWVTKDNGGTAVTRRRPAMGMMHGRMGRGGPSDGGPLLEPVYDAYAVNGRVYPAVEPLSVKKGERIKLRILNPSSATIYDLRLAGHSFTITHADGNPVEPLQTDVLRIGMGERYDVEFMANRPGNWLLSAMERGFGESLLRIPVIYQNEAKKEPSPPTFHRGLRWAHYGDLRSGRPEPVSRADKQSRFFQQVLSGGMHSPYWTINGRVHPRSERLRVNMGQRIRLGYVNHSMMPHPMHLHGHFFKVVNPALPSEQWVTKDTVIVDSMQRMEIEFEADNPGRWFHHCHNLYHMEAGMANVIEYG